MRREPLPVPRIEGLRRYRCGRFARCPVDRYRRNPVEPTALPVPVAALPGLRGWPASCLQAEGASRASQARRVQWRRTLPSESWGRYSGRAGLNGGGFRRSSRSHCGTPSTSLAAGESASAWCVGWGVVELVVVVEG